MLCSDIRVFEYTNILLNNQEKHNKRVLCYTISLVSKKILLI